MLPPHKDSSPTVIDLFAGCGGLSLGLHQAGFRTIAFSELNDHAAETYRTNRAPGSVDRFGDVHALLENGVVQRLKQRRLPKGRKDVDLVVGGPPCQGYSAIGHRRTHRVERLDLPANHLYLRMIDVIRLVKPRMFLFENVRGIMTGRWTEEGQPGEIWADVLGAFESIANYHVDFALVHAKDYGVPQNRPRVLLVGVRRDLGLRPTRGGDAVAGGLLPIGRMIGPDAVDVLGDLEDESIECELRAGRGLGRTALRTANYPHPARTAFQREMRKSADGGHVAKKYEPITEQEYSRHTRRVVEKFSAMLDNGGSLNPGSPFRTKKFAQRVIPERWDPQVGPTITATSLPDDFVHFRQPRILTVREWARLQTFPDWYSFRGPRTTGGARRAGNPTAGDFSREVPRYTQIGNAVPVRLARVVGEHFAQLLKG